MADSPQSGKWSPFEILMNWGGYLLVALCALLCGALGGSFAAGQASRLDAVCRFGDMVQFNACGLFGAFCFVVAFSAACKGVYPDSVSRKRLCQAAFALSCLPVLVAPSIVFGHGVGSSCAFLYALCAPLSVFSYQTLLGKEGTAKMPVRLALIWPAVYLVAATMFQGYLSYGVVVQGALPSGVSFVAAVYVMLFLYVLSLGRPVGWKGSAGRGASVDGGRQGPAQGGSSPGEGKTQASEGGGYPRMSARHAVALFALLVACWAFQDWSMFYCVAAALLLASYEAWDVTEQMRAVSKGDKDRYVRATNIVYVVFLVFVPVGLPALASTMPPAPGSAGEPYVVAVVAVGYALVLASVYYANEHVFFRIDEGRAGQARASKVCFSAATASVAVVLLCLPELLYDRPLVRFADYSVLRERLFAIPWASLVGAVAVPVVSLFAERFAEKLLGSSSADAPAPAGGALAVTRWMLGLRDGQSFGILSAQTYGRDQFRVTVRAAALAGVFAAMVVGCVFESRAYVVSGFVGAVAFPVASFLDSVVAVGAQGGGDAR